MRKYLVLSILLMIIMIFACENYDNTPPEVSIDSPVDFAPVFDITLVEITATDDEAMSHVELFVDGASTGLADSTLPYIIEWDTYQYENRSNHILVVRAYDLSENQNHTDSESIRVLVDNTNFYPESIDQIVTVYENNGFTLTWDQSNDEDFHSYSLEKFANSLLDTSTIVFESFDIETHTYRDTLIDPLVEYFYVVIVTDSSGLSTRGRHNQSPSPIQYIPSGVYGTTSENSIVLRWNDNTPFESGFKIERDDGVGFKPIAEVDADITGYTDDSLEYDIQYRYRIAAYTETNQTDYSDIASVSSPLKFSPSDLAAIASDTSIVLTWRENSLFEAGFRLERSEGTGFTQIAELGSGITTFSDFDIDEDTYYTYRVAAFTASSQSDYSFSISLYSPLSFAPTSLSYSTTETSIVLRWNDNSIIEDGFRLERDEGLGFEQIAELAANTTGYTDTNLVYDVTYRYQIAAFTTAKQSNFSNILLVSSPLQFAPSNLSATGGDTTVTLEWKDNSGFEEGFIVERRTDAGFVEIAKIAANITSFVDSDLTEDEFYSYRVAAYTATSQSNYSSLVSIFSPIEFAPTSLSALATDTSIVLRWADNSIFEDGFRIERDAGIGFEEIAEVGTDTTAYTDYDLIYGLQYRYRVRAYTASSVSEYTFSIAVNSPLEYAPSGLNAVVGDTTILLLWADNCTFEDGFSIERDAGIGFEEIAELGPNMSSYSDNDLEEGALYKYRIAAFTTSSQSDFSSTVSVSSPLVFAPTNLVGTLSNNSIVLEWDDDCIFEDGFTIERDAGSGFTQIATVGSDITTYTDSYLNYNTEYSYRVAAFDGSDQSNYTDVISEIISYANLEWVTVTGGDYTFGETDVVRSELGADFEIMKYEVTNAQYVTFLEEMMATNDLIVTVDSINGAYPGDGNWPAANDYLYYDFTQQDGRIDWNESYFTIAAGYENHPVVAVTWFGASAFATHYGWDLPTEFQWEKAARGNTGNDYPWGDNGPTCDLANYSSCNDGTIPVGQTSGISPFGAYDMIGNAWEWTKSYDTINFDGTEDNHTIRGGSWSFYTDNLKAWNWLPASPKYSYYLIGFRCVR